MIKLKINNAKTFIPLSISKGTQEQRMQKARLLNLAFYDNLQECIRNNEIAPRTFINKLNSTIGTRLGINIIGTESKKDSCLSYCFNSKATSIGYTIGLPLTFYSDRIHKNNAQTFLKETQNLLNEAFNPKILRRFVKLINKGYDIKSIINFYKNNIAQTAVLNKKDLDTFLDKKSNTEKIDILQFFRYKLLSEKNTLEATKQIDKRIEKHNNLRYEHHENYYNLEKYQFDSKFGTINQILSDFIQLERN